ncbi:EscF/YscF/HrpA family type III secretion system needle major subunit [Mesorhizobium sangaii]|uniref:Type III secretion protein F n=1 Tax=Mesorhizobium sangaii TaxID=505389 RepID=A0A841PN71_9HYPH|nr:EscF/YscF/HrpA family type III secretion system needle major subunit [Mesorhizobium sangaii]MBB6414118.1 type III secretion protein F [Mesorhizobium sangaii]
MSPISGHNLTVSSISSSLGNATVEAERSLNSLMASMEPDNPTDLIRIQSLAQQWSLSLTLESGVIKLLYDALKGVSQKIS